ncbi:TlpA disulfide reductase family protein [uncultured Bacteroides sp.]|uniref:TlpA disulfide reductase family protein n=1 Tax=uncultured Bacteroides sp. TaxID=162156 RepID=UPI002AA6625A|nr:TlpA disulfide reductase family protein [uncultured Bacteroides sp.]
MRKIIYLFAATTLGLAACTGGNKGYTVTGTVEGAVNGDTVFLQERANRQFNKLDTAVIADGTFAFKGVQDSTVNRYITYVKGDKQLIMDFFLENGKINVKLGKEDDSATGTLSNDAYQEFRTKINVINNKENAIYESMSDTTLTDKQKEAKIKEMDALEKDMLAVIKTSIEKNISNTVGVFLLNQYNYYMEYTEIEPLLAKVPANFLKNENILHLKELIKTAKATAVGQKFVDIEMLTPEGKPIKLSDYAGKGKVVLVDFWASWCGPCRQEMPNLVSAYAKYKNKGFEIVGVSLDKDGESWKGGIKQLNITWPQMSDLKYWDSEGSKLYAIRSIPHTVLIDKDGTILAHSLRGEELLAKLTELLK